jgi:hypothetical protein
VVHPEMRGVEGDGGVEVADREDDVVDGLHCDWRL